MPLHDKGLTSRFYITATSAPTLYLFGELPGMYPGSDDLLLDT